MSTLRKILIYGGGAILLIALLIGGAAGYEYYRAVNGKGEASVSEFTLRPPAKIKLGDVVTAEATVKAPWGQYPDKAELTVPEGLQVVTEPEITKTGEKWGKSIWKITAQVQPYRTGTIKKSKFDIAIAREKDGKTEIKQVKRDMPGFKVLAVDTGNDRSLAIGAPVKYKSLSSGNLWLLIATLVLSLIGIVIFLIILLRKRQEVIKSMVLPPWALALSLLEELRQELKKRKLQGQVCVTRLTDIVRDYLEKRFDIHAPSQTTHEFLSDLDKSNSPLSLEHKQFLRDFLTAADMVKFAKLPADEALLENALDKAEQLVESTTPDKNDKMTEKGD